MALLTAISLNHGPLNTDTWSYILPFLNYKAHLYLRACGKLFHALPLEENLQTLFSRNKKQYEYRLWLRTLPAPTVITYEEEAERDILRNRNNFFFHEVPVPQIYNVEPDGTGFILR
jgi:hypothetical protein